MPLETVIVKNKYYPRGLTEEDVINHYVNKKQKILDELNRRNVILFIYPQVNKWVVKRKINGMTIVLNNANYNSIITGRTVSISVERRSKVSYLCVDVDPGPNTDELILKDAVRALLNSSLRSLSNRERIISSAKGYHVYFYLKKQLSIAAAHKTLSNLLNMEFSNKYILGGKPPKGNEIKFDTTPTRNKGSHTVAGALCRNGLICTDCTLNFDRFKRSKAAVK